MKKNLCVFGQNSTFKRVFPGLGGLKETKMFLPHPLVKLSIVGSLRDREVACWASDLAKYSLYVHKSGLKPNSFHFKRVFLAKTVYSRVLLRPHPHPTFCRVPHPPPPPRAKSKTFNQ